jgi:hypothetical protein
MNANEIVLKFTLDIKGIKSAINQVEKDLKQFGSESVGATQGLNNALEETEQQLNNIKNKSRGFAQPVVNEFVNLRKSAGAANGSVIAFGRIIQDAPFGILGVANNIQSFSEQFSALGTQAGAAGGRLKLFFSALITPTNLAVLAVSALTAAWQAYNLGLFDSEEKTRDLNKELEYYIQNLKGVEKATLEGAITTEQEILKFKTLASVLTDTNSSYTQRKNAIDKIKSGYGEYIGNLTDEQILVKGLGKAYDDVISALIAKSALEANEKEISANIKETLEVQKKVNAEQKLSLGFKELIDRKNRNLIRTQELIDSGEIKGSKTKQQLQSDIERLEAEQEKYNLSIKNGKEVIDENNVTLKNLIDTYKENLKSLLSYEKGQDDAAVSGDKLNRVFDEQILIVERFGTASEDAKKKLQNLAGVNLDSLAKEQKSLFEQIARLKQEPINFVNAASLIIAEQKLSEIDKIIGSIASKRTNTEITVDESKLEGLEKTLFGKGKVQALEDEISSLQARIKVTVDPEALSRYQGQLETAQEALSDLLGKRKLQVEDLSQAFVGLGSVIGKAFNNPQLGTFVSQFASFVGQIVAGAFAVAKANAVAGATQSSLFTGPAAAFTLPAFVASAVGVVASAFAALGSFGGGGGSVSAGSGSTFTNRREFGGPVSKGRAYIVGEKRPELFVPNTNGIIVPQLPSMDYSGASMAAGAMAVDVNIRGVSYGDDILFTVQQAQIRRGLR